MRRGKRGAPVLPYADATDGLRRLRDRALATYVAPFDGMELMQALFPRPLLDTMNHVFPLLTSSAKETPLLGAVAVEGNEHMLVICPGKLQLACPSFDLVQPNFNSPVWGHLKSLARELAQWKEADEVVDYFNAERATPSAVAYYWPCMATLVSSSHPIHRVAPGAAFKEPRNLGRHIQSIRRSAVTVAGGLLCPPPESNQSAGIIAQVSINNSGYIPLIREA